MKVYIVMLREEIIEHPENYGCDIYNDYVLKVYDSSAKATEFCEKISGVIDPSDESYEIKDFSYLYDFRDIIGYIDEDYGHYSMYIIERDVE